MLLATCHCGCVSLEIASAPQTVTECNCSVCRRYGVLWAYYSPRDVMVSAAEPTGTYQWDDRAIAFHRCARCGCVTHWSAVDPARNRMGVNARLLPPQILQAARIRHLDGAVSETYLD
ncbi:GFA family protein [Terrarubrum flagellatum]|uniref:GFA family protein n=1 Tax=Terrirubrum flagellatum TaxID=2895980 RepID=UPI00314515B0